jgi:uncharacterized paraquat-inducible protein A
MELDITCPRCHGKFKLPMREMKPGNSARCPSCSATINFTGDDLSKTQDGIDDLKRSIKKIGDIKIKL